MTRINVVPVEELADQHLIAEYREISRMPVFLKRSLASKKPLSIPEEYVFGKGHVSFFYDKLAYIKERHDALKVEGFSRGFNLSSITMSLSDIHPRFCNNYDPTPSAISLNKERILSKLIMKPEWYKYRGEPISPTFIEKYK